MDSNKKQYTNYPTTLLGILKKNPGSTILQKSCCAANYLTSHQPTKYDE